MALIGVHERAARHIDVSGPGAKIGVSELAGIYGITQGIKRIPSDDDYGRVDQRRFNERHAVGSEGHSVIRALDQEHTVDLYPDLLLRRADVLYV